MAKDLSKIAKQKKIKYFLISFVDLFVLMIHVIESHDLQKLYHFFPY